MYEYEVFAFSTPFNSPASPPSLPPPPIPLHYNYLLVFNQTGWFGILLTDRFALNHRGMAHKTTGTFSS